MIKKYYILLFLFVSTITSVAFSQKKTTEIKIELASGEYIGGHSDPVEEVKNKAINKAKADALHKAGIAENINSYSDFFRTETDNKYEELFASDILSNIRGSVKNVKVLDSDIEVTETHIKVKANISCTVIKYNTEPDLSFGVKIEGIKAFYNEGDGLSFLVLPTKDSYVHAFMFTSESFILLPNEYEPAKLLPANEETRFPGFPGDYVLDAGGSDKEVNRLVLVFTKEKLPYNGKVEYKAITDWIMSIPPDEKVIESFAFTVVKE